jgi:hypothetical protein
MSLFAPGPAQNQKAMKGNLFRLGSEKRNARHVTPSLLRALAAPISHSIVNDPKMLQSEIDRIKPYLNDKDVSLGVYTPESDDLSVEQLLAPSLHDLILGEWDLTRYREDKPLLYWVIPEKKECFTPLMLSVYLSMVYTSAYVSRFESTLHEDGAYLYYRLYVTLSHMKMIIDKMNEIHMPLDVDADRVACMHKFTEPQNFGPRYGGLVNKKDHYQVAAQYTRLKQTREFEPARLFQSVPPSLYTLLGTLLDELDETLHVPDSNRGNWMAYKQAKQENKNMRNQMRGGRRKTRKGKKKSKKSKKRKTRRS